MKIVICGSVNFPEKIREVEKGLKDRGHEVVVPYSIIKHNLNTYEDADRLKGSEGFVNIGKKEFTKRHFDEVRNSDAILVVNVEKHGIENYIGGATFSEIMLAFYYNKRIFLLNPIPIDKKVAFFKDEIESVDPIMIDGDLDLVK